jgi:uncharacterized protein (TIGR00369 family)
MSKTPKELPLGLMMGGGRTPYANALGAEMISVDRGRVRMRLPYSDRLIGNPDTGVVHGGVITGFLDQSCGMAVGSTLTQMRAFATLDLRIDYMKPATPKKTILFEGECIKLTKEIAFARARAFHESSDDPIAIATATFMFTQMPVPGA